MGAVRAAAGAGAGAASFFSFLAAEGALAPAAFPALDADIDGAEADAADVFVAAFFFPKLSFLTAERGAEADGFVFSLIERRGRAIAESSRARWPPREQQMML